MSRLTPLLSSLPVCRVFAVLLTLALLPGAATAQLEVEDLPIEEELVSPQIEQLFQEATELFQTVDQADSVPLFGRIIEELLPMRITGDERVLELLHTSLLHRAQAHYNFGDGDLARKDLVTLVTASPRLEIDRDTVSDQVADLFEDVRSDLVGFAEFVVDPADAIITAEGTTYDPGAGPVPILAGAYTAMIARPGYSSTTTTFDVAPGDGTTVEATLERTSAVISLSTRPAEARVFVDGVERARTSGRAGSDFTATGAAAAYDRSEFSEKTFIEGLEPGRHRVEVRKAGFRPFETAVEIDGLVDVPLGPVLLEQEAGTLVFQDLPADATVEVDRQAVRPIRSSGDENAELQLSPGTYVVSVSQGVFGRFESTVDIADRETTRVRVRLRPALVLLGVLGGDDVGVRQFLDGLTDAFQRKDEWTLLDRSVSAVPVLEELGLDPDRLRGSLAGLRQDPVDWPRVQRTFDDRLPGSVFILGVLSDDLLANEANLWIWPASPGPSQPELRRIRLDDEDTLASFAEGFQPVLEPIRPTFGATLVDTPLADGPVIVHLVPGGAAATAGLAVGDAIVSLGETPVFSASLFFEELLRREAGETFDATVERAGQQLQVEARAGRSYTVIDLSDPDRLAAPVAAALAAELQRASDWPRWVLQLNQARILLHAGDAEGAVRELREIDASQMPPRDHVGLGPGTVDYWLGSALERAGPRYFDRAREAYERAASAPDARFLHDDGPRVAPRAWARLQRLVPRP